jgi:hypothetical protein
MKISLKFLWYDMWLGAYWDREKRALYLCPLPMIVIKIQTTNAGKISKGNPSL